MECKNCYTELKQYSKFCYECGTKVGLSCVNCSNELLDKAKFCSECGTPVNNINNELKQFTYENKSNNFGININKNINFNVGDYIKFGKFKGRDLIWIVINHDENNNPMLFSEKVICNSLFGKNSTWRTSNLRTWLNNKHIEAVLNPIYLPLNECKYKDNYDYQFYRDKKVEYCLNVEKGRKEIGSKIENINNNYEKDKKEIIKYTKESDLTEYELRKIFKCEYIFEEDEQGFLNQYNFNDYEYSLIKLNSYKTELSHNMKIGILGYNGEKLSKLKNINFRFENIKPDILQDRVFLLSFDEILDMYKKELSDLIKAKYLIKHEQQFYYWLRTPFPEHGSCILISGYNDSINTQDCIQGFVGVRPALYLNKSKIEKIYGNGSKDNPFIL